MFICYKGNGKQGRCLKGVSVAAWTVGRVLSPSFCISVMHLLGFVLISGCRTCYVFGTWGKTAWSWAYMLHHQFYASSFAAFGYGMGSSLKIRQRLTSMTPCMFHSSKAEVKPWLIFDMISRPALCIMGRAFDVDITQHF